MSKMCQTISRDFDCMVPLQPRFLSFWSQLRNTLSMDSGSEARACLGSPIGIAQRDTAALKLVALQNRSQRLGKRVPGTTGTLSVLRSDTRGFWDTFTKSVPGVVACKPGARIGFQIGTDSTISRCSWTSARSDLGDSTLGCAQPLGRPPGTPGWPQNRPRPARGFRERFLCLPDGQRMLRHNCRRK